MSRSLIVLGDGLVAGFGDTRRLGWIGRVLARSTTPELDFTAVLPVPRETSTHLAERWKAETSVRWGRAEERRLVLGLGSADVDARVSLARTRLNLANVLDEALQDRLSVFVVGPPPSLVEPDAVAALDGAAYDVCDRRGVPYAAMYTSLRADSRWLEDLGTTDGVHPSQVGYGMMAHLVIAQGWHAWFGSDEAVI